MPVGGVGMIGNNDDILPATVGSCMRDFTDSRSRSFVPVSVHVFWNRNSPSSTLPLGGIFLARERLYFELVCDTIGWVNAVKGSRKVVPIAARLHPEK